MRYNPVHRAYRQGTKTEPVESKRKSKVIKGNIRLDAEELAIAIKLARRDRVEHDIRDYAYHKTKAASAATPTASTTPHQGANQ